MRKRPYTATGIRRKKCGCGKPARFQWGCCALPGYFLPVCEDCDIKLNETLMRTAGVPDRKDRLDAYRKQVRGANSRLPRRA